jgi:hypothetical protein
MIDLIFTKDNAKYLYTLFFKYRLLYAFCYILLMVVVEAFFNEFSPYWQLSLKIIFWFLNSLPILFFNLSITLELLKQFQTLFCVYNIFIIVFCGCWIQFHTATVNFQFNIYLSIYITHAFYFVSVLFYDTINSNLVPQKASRIAFYSDKLLFEFICLLNYNF